jgi:hypothetical protein
MAKRCSAVISQGATCQNTMLSVLTAMRTIETHPAYFFLYNDFLFFFINTVFDTEIYNKCRATSSRHKSG